MDLSNEADLKRALRLAGLAPHKGLSQNFLVDKAALVKIVKAASLKSNDVVLEIGPGPGVLTQELIKTAEHVIAVEKDINFYKILTAQKHSNLTVVNEDFKNYNLTKLPKGYKVVANLPYVITSYVLQTLLTSINKPKSVTVMVQKEVAERVCAKAGDMSTLALSVQFYGTPTLAGIINRASFWPSPKVDSAILHIDVENKYHQFDDKKLFRLVNIGFAARRKMLKNNLMAGLQLTAEEVDNLLNKSGINLLIRAQDLSLDNWFKIYTNLYK